jgi:phosphatidyl-myo-inositol dimannoside synthase
MPVDVRPAGNGSRILLVNVGFLPRIGGSFRALYEMARRFPVGSVDVLTSCHLRGRMFDQGQPLPIRRSRMLSLLDDDGIVWGSRPVRHRGWVRFLIRLRVFTIVAMVTMLIKVLLEARRHRYSFLIAGQGWVVGWPVWCASRVWGIPYGVLAYGEDIAQIMNGGRHDLIAWLFLKSLRGAEWVVSNSAATGELTARAGIDRAKIHTLRPAVDTELFQPQSSRLRRDYDPGTRIVLSVGRLTPQKNFGAVISALPLVRREVPCVKYLIRGDGPEKASLQALARSAGVEDCVEFIPERGYEELPDVYNACDLFVMPNRTIPATGEQEGFGMVFIEASACAKPVIGGRSGGAVEAVLDGRTGILVEPENVEELAAAMIRVLLDSDLAAHLGKNGRRYVEDSFSWEAYAARVQGLIASSGVNDCAAPPCAAAGAIGEDNSFRCRR